MGYLPLKWPSRFPGCRDDTGQGGGGDHRATPIREIQRMTGSATIRAEVHFTAFRLEELQLKDRNIVVLDVLRAGTSIATALHNGAKQIIPVNNIESAMKISGGLSTDVTLKAGERNAKMIEGFHLGNSPREFTPEAVKGKSIIFLTTNGTSAVVRGKHARNLVMGGFVNLSAIVGFLADLRSRFRHPLRREGKFIFDGGRGLRRRILNTLSARHAATLELNDSAVAR